MIIRESAYTVHVYARRASLILINLIAHWQILQAKAQNECLLLDNKKIENEAHCRQIFQLLAVTSHVQKNICVGLDIIVITD